MCAGRLFVAVWPPASLVARLRQLDRPARPGLRWTTEDQWHVTLRFLGAVDRDACGPLRQALARVAAGSNSVEAHAGPAPRALGRGVWVLPIEGLEPLATRVRCATAEVGQPVGERPYRGHITLARARRPAALAGLAQPAGAPGAGSFGAADHWRVADLSLVRSELRADGARYRVVAEWPLAGGAD
jgi:RNA 2',3'-cyclic 3'-phosphodiesterase